MWGAPAMAKGALGSLKEGLRGENKQIFFAGPTVQGLNKVMIRPWDAQTEKNKRFRLESFYFFVWASDSLNKPLIRPY